MMAAAHYAPVHNNNNNKCIHIRRADATKRETNKQKCIQLTKRKRKKCVRVCRDVSMCECACVVVHECMSRVQQMPRIERQLYNISSLCLGSWNFGKSFKLLYVRRRQIGRCRQATK